MNCVNFESGYFVILVSLSPNANESRPNASHFPGSLSFQSATSKGTTKAAQAIGRPFETLLVELLLRTPYQGSAPETGGPERSAEGVGKKVQAACPAGRAGFNVGQDEGGNGQPET